MADNKVDLVLLDIRMAQINSIDVLKTIKEKHPDVIVIMLTAYGSEANRQAAESLGAYEFIIKPFDIAVLRESMKHALSETSK